MAADLHRGARGRLGDALTVVAGTQQMASVALIEPEMVRWSLAASGDTACLPTRSVSQR
jgi:hypothetical protein